jgi:hypothetical protein
MVLGNCATTPQPSRHASRLSCCPSEPSRQPSAFDIPQLPAQPALGTATRSASISRGPENDATRNKAMALRDALTSHMTDQIAEAKRNASEWVSK